MAHLLVTNDFPPKVGGIQSYLHELWRRLPPEETTVFTTAHRGAAEWDEVQPFRVVRARSPFLGPTPRLVRRIDALADEVGADLVMLDPASPLGAIGPELERPYGLILHGAEVTVPARLPFAQLPLRRSLRGASLIIAAGEYPAAEGRYSAGRRIDATIVPPGVDAGRFRPLAAEQRAVVRERYGVGSEVLVLGVSRLVRRKGFDVLIAAAAQLAEDDPDLRFTVLIAGGGRDQERLQALIGQTGAPVRLVGRVSEDDLPLLYGAADVFAMLCRDQWSGLEQEGFGIVFLEAAAAGVPALAGTSGGSAEAVAHDVSGLVVEDPRSVADVRDALERLVADEPLRRRLGAAARERAVRQFSYDVLAVQLRDAITATIDHLRAQAAERARDEAAAAASTEGSDEREPVGAVAAQATRPAVRPIPAPREQGGGDRPTAPSGSGGPPLDLRDPVRPVRPRLPAEGLLDWDPPDGSDSRARRAGGGGPLPRRPGAGGDRRG
jgi:phosphatidylinositol alpha-1,6-mannosyltransferase